MAALASICIHFHDCFMPVSPAPPRPPITCLSTWLCVCPQTESAIFASFSKPQAWLRGAVVETVQVCAFTFFFTWACQFLESTFSDAAVGWRRINRHHLSALHTQVFFFSCAFENININRFLDEFMYFSRSEITLNNQRNGFLRSSVLFDPEPFHEPRVSDHCSIWLSKNIFVTSTPAAAGFDSLRLHCD